MEAGGKSQYEAGRAQPDVERYRADLAEVDEQGAAQRDAAEASKQRWDETGTFADPIVTEIVPAGSFHPAGDEHRDYYFQNKGQGYCRAVIAPKLSKLGLRG